MEKLQKLHLPPKSEKVVKGVWEMTEEKKDYIEMIYILRPITALIVLNLFMAANSDLIIEPVKNAFYLIAMAIVLVFFIGATILQIFHYSRVLASEERKIILDWSNMCLFTIQKDFRMFLLLSTLLIMFAAFVECSANLFIGFSYCFTLGYSDNKELTIRRKIGREIIKIENE